LVLAIVMIANASELSELSNLKSLALVTFLLAYSVFLRAWIALPTLLVYFFGYLYWAVIPEWAYTIPTVPMLVPFGLTYMVLRSAKLKEAHFLWFRKGELDRITWLWVIATVICSTAALLGWAMWTGIPSLSMPPVFSLVNALVEELVFRGIIQESLQKSLHKPWLVIGFQASAFAALHFAAGFPNGFVGYAMTFTYASMLGYLRLRSGGILAPSIAHVGADLCIGYFLMYGVPV
jgi:membrane protease YdiL (CAAX protease family)